MTEDESSFLGAYAKSLFSLINFSEEIPTRTVLCVRIRATNTKIREKENENKIITKIEHAASTEQVSRIEQTTRTPREKKRTKARCVGREGRRTGCIVAAMVARS